MAGATSGYACREAVWKSENYDGTVSALGNHALNNLGPTSQEERDHWKARFQKDLSGMRYTQIGPMVALDIKLAVIEPSSVIA